MSRSSSSHQADRRSAPTVGAFFDVDNTLLPGEASEVRFFRYLWQRGIVGLREAVESLWCLLRHVPPVSFQPLRLKKLYLAGKRPAEIEPLAEAFCRTHLIPRLSAEAMDQVDRHRRAGHRLVLITGSLECLIKPMAEFLRVETVIAARLEEGLSGYTGRLLPPLPYADGKRALIEAHAKEHGVDLSASYAYGDSPGDVELLEVVGHPTVVNPIRGMARIAKHRGWPVNRWAS